MADSESTAARGGGDGHAAGGATGRSGPSCVAVYCGSHNGTRPEYARDAEKLARCLVRRGIKVVFGGSTFGLLGVVGQTVVKNGGQLTGIIPEFFTKISSYERVGEEIVVEDMHTRKKMMFDSADAFIALPGGVGTMEELTEMLTWSKLDLHQKAVGLLNTAGYYDHFLQWIARGIEDQFIPSQSVDELLVVDSDPQSLVDHLCERCTEVWPKTTYESCLTSNS